MIPQFFDIKEKEGEFQENLELFLQAACRRRKINDSELLEICACFDIDIEQEHYYEYRIMTRRLSRHGWG